MSWWSISARRNIVRHSRSTYLRAYLREADGETTTEEKNLWTLQRECFNQNVQKHKKDFYNPVTKTWQVSTTKRNEVPIFQDSSDEEMLEDLDSNDIPMEGMYENDASVPHIAKPLAVFP